MDALIKLLSRALARTVKFKGAVIAAKADTKCTASYNKLTLIDMRIERLEKQLVSARTQRDEAVECLQKSTLNRKAARDVQAHYDAHAEEVLNFYPSTTEE